MGKITLIHVVIALSITYSNCHLVWSDASELQPVHGLYIKPSADGSTGDLFVAATENTGTKSQWLTDQPVNYLPAATQLQPTAVPLTLTSSLTKTSTPLEETISTQKRATVTSPPINYAYALPFPTPEGLLAPYPYTVAASADGTSSSTCSEGMPASHYSTAYQYFYPQMIASLSRAMNTFNGADGKESTNNPLSPPPFWPQAYTYPYQYVLVDPNTWAQSQKETQTQSKAETNSDESS